MNHFIKFFVLLVRCETVHFKWLIQNKTGKRDIKPRAHVSDLEFIEIKTSEGPLWGLMIAGGP
jgi:hypothetical protein